MSVVQTAEGALIATEKGRVTVGVNTDGTVSLRVLGTDGVINGGCLTPAGARWLARHARAAARAITRKAEGASK